MEREYVPLYRGSRLDSVRNGHEAEWDASFRENVCCARAIEAAIRDSMGDQDQIRPGCAKPVLAEYGFKRTMFVLAHSVMEFGPNVQASADVMEWSRGVLPTPNSGTGRYYTVDTAVSCMEDFIGQVREAYQMLGMYDGHQCSLGMYDENVEGKVLVMKPSTLKEACWSVENQLWLAEGGFGCDPKAGGRAIYAVCLADGERVRWNREDFVGVLGEQYLPRWAQEKLSALRSPKQEQTAAPTMGGMTMG